jgi:polyhydroxyalkanoate synthesis repressor PhaR
MAEPNVEAPVEAVPAGPERTPPRVIKRYSNRKLYDTERSRYVTLEEIAEMIKAGEEVEIIDNRTKGDLTSATLAQIIFESEKRQSKMPLAMLRNLIQSSGDALGDFFDKQVKTPVEAARHNAQRTAEDIFKSAAQLRDAATRELEELSSTARRMFGRGHSAAVDKRVDTVARRYEASFDEITKRIEVQLREAQKDGPEVIEPLIERLSHRIEDVKMQLAKLHDASLGGVSAPGGEPPAPDAPAGVNGVARPEAEAPAEDGTEPR